MEFAPLSTVRFEHIYVNSISSNNSVLRLRSIDRHMYVEKQTFFIECYS